MMEKSISISVSSAIMEVEIMRKRAAVLSSDLKQDFFDLKPEKLKLYQDEARVKNDIVFDYLVRMQEKLEEMQELLVEGAI